MGNRHTKEKYMQALTLIFKHLGDFEYSSKKYGQSKFLSKHFIFNFYLSITVDQQTFLYFSFYTVGFCFQTFLPPNF